MNSNKKIQSTKPLHSEALGLRLRALTSKPDCPRPNPGSTIVVGRVVASAKKCLPGAWECDRIWKRGLCSWYSDKNLRWDRLGLDGTLNPHTNVFKRNVKEGRDGRSWGDDGGRDWSDASASQGPRSSEGRQRPPEPRRRATAPSLTASRGSQLRRCPVSDFWPPNYENKGLLFQVRFVVICYDGLQKLTRTSMLTEEAKLGEVT